MIKVADLALSALAPCGKYNGGDHVGAVRHVLPLTEGARISFPLVRK